jgi:hypothetical protein
MKPTDDSLPTDWWSTDDVLRYLKLEGAPVQRYTWLGYVSRGEAPPADRRFGRSPAWLPETIRNWHSGRPRKGTK